MFDHVIRKATIADGSGAALFEGDIAVSGGKIVAVGDVPGRGVAETDASGLIATPGFVDIHTHYDGQITWENRLMPSSNHGVTTAVMGNCGIGFAPCRPEDRETLIRVMEGVEDIPEVVMAEGLPWSWETFPDYIRVLEGRNCDIDFAAQVPHAAIRVNVMGERGANREAATAAELEKMSRLVAAGIRAGAIGVSTSRSVGHRSADGALAPTVHAAEQELQALARGLRDAGTGIFQLIGSQEAHDPAEEVAMFRRLTRISGRPLSFTLLNIHQFPAYAQRYLDALDAASRQDGPRIRGQVYPRPVGIILGLELSFHPFKYNPSFHAIAKLPLKERIAAMRDPGLRRKLLAERPEHPNPLYRFMAGLDANLYIMDEIPDYEPMPDRQVGAIAAGRGLSPRELIYDLMIETDGLVTFMSPAANFGDGSLDMVKTLMDDPNTIIGLGDGGAHYGMISDGSYPTTLLTHWTRDRTRGPRLTLPRVVHMLTRANAEAIGMRDRGLIGPGMKANINLIDYDRLQLHRPVGVPDLPAGGHRLIQKADGYAMTMVNGTVTYRQGAHTGELPGRLVKSSATWVS